MARLPDRLHPAEPARSRRPVRPAPRDRRPALLPDRRRQDRGLSGARRVRHGPPPAAEPRGRRPDRGRSQRHHALHAAPADLRPVGAGRRPRLRAGAGAGEGSRALRGMAVRDRSLGREGRHPQRDGAPRRPAVRHREEPVFGVPARPEEQARTDPAHELPLVRGRVRAEFVLTATEPRPSAQSEGGLRPTRLRLRPQPRTAHRGRGRATLPKAAGLPHRHRGQVPSSPGRDRRRRSPRAATWESPRREETRKW